MEWFNAALARAGDDPVMLALMFLAIWVPLCALGLGALAVLAAVQERWFRRAKRGPAVVLPPQEVRPLVTRRYITPKAHGGGAIGLARVALAVVAVLGLTVFVIMATGRTLLDAASG